MKHCQIACVMAAFIGVPQVSMGEILTGPILNPVNQHLYYLVDSGGPWWRWTDAETEAQALGGHLATIDDAAENSWVLDTFGSEHNLWIGLFQPPNSSDPEHEWYWISGEPVQFLNWDSGEPNNLRGERYVHMWVSRDADGITRHPGQWNNMEDEVGENYMPLGVVEVVPEPSTILLWLGLSGIGLVTAWRRSRHAASRSRPLE